MARNNWGVEIERSGIDEISEIRLVLMRFAEKMGKRIIVSNPHGRVCEPFRGRRYDLCIYFWSVPKEANAHRFASVYGYWLRTSQSYGYILPEDDKKYPGRKIVDLAGNTVALIVGRTLYILFDLPHSGGNSVGLILKRVLNDYELYLSGVRKFDLEMKKRQEIDSVAGKFCESYSTALSGYVENDYLEEINDKIKRLKRELTNAMRDRKVITEKLKSAEGMEKPIYEDYDKMLEVYNRLCKLSVTGKISVTGSNFTVPVGQIDIEYEGVVYDIGEFDIEIPFDPDDHVHCINKTRTVCSCYHPHVDDDGNCCLGDADYGITLLLGDLELETIVLMMIEFLKSYSPENPYLELADWLEEQKEDEDDEDDEDSEEDGSDETGSVES